MRVSAFTSLSSLRMYASILLPYTYNEPMHLHGHTVFCRICSVHPTSIKEPSLSEICHPLPSGKKSRPRNGPALQNAGRGLNVPPAVCSVLLPERSADTRLTPSAPIIGILQSAGSASEHSLPISLASAVLCALPLSLCGCLIYS